MGTVFAGTGVGNKKNTWRLPMSPLTKIFVALFPLPSKWKFLKGEVINIIKCLDVVAEEGHVRKKAIVRTIKAQWLEVKFTNGEGLIHISWAAVQKQHKVGVFIQISHGPYQGCSGWVLIISVHKITCTKELSPPSGIETLEFVP